MYRQLGVELPGKVAVKVHSGEDGNQNFLRPEFWKPMVEEVKGTVVEGVRIADSPLRPEPVLEIRVRPRRGMLRCSRCGGLDIRLPQPRT